MNISRLRSRGTSGRAKRLVWLPRFEAVADVTDGLDVGRAYRRAEFQARQIAHLALANVVRRFQFASASGAQPLPIPALPAYPQLELLGTLIDLVPVHSVPPGHPSSFVRSLSRNR